MKLRTLLALSTLLFSTAIKAEQPPANKAPQNRFERQRIITDFDQLCEHANKKFGIKADKLPVLRPCADQTFSLEQCKSAAEEATEHLNKEMEKASAALKAKETAPTPTPASENIQVYIRPALLPPTPTPRSN